MNELPLILGLAIFVGIVLFNRRQQEKALAALDDAEKGRMVGAFAKHRSTNFLFLLGSIGLGFFLSTWFHWNYAIVNTIVLIAYVLFTQYRTKIKLAEINADPDYINTTNRIMWLNLIGMILFACGLVISLNMLG